MNRLKRDALPTTQTFDTSPLSAASARGQKTLAEVLKAAVEIVSESGIANLSQESVARRAKISQSTLRHYFPTKEALVDAIFEDSFRRYYAGVQIILLDPAIAPGDKLMRIVEQHLRHIMHTSDSFNFDAFAHLSRDARGRAKQNEWYRWLCGQYASLLRQSNSHLGAKNSQALAVQILTLCLGAWITLGQSRGKWLGHEPAEINQGLLSLVRTLIGAAHAAPGP